MQSGREEIQPKRIQVGLKVFSKQDKERFVLGSRSLGYSIIGDIGLSSNATYLAESLSFRDYHKSLKHHWADWSSSAQNTHVSRPKQHRFASISTVFLSERASVHIWNLVVVVCRCFVRFFLSTWEESASETETMEHAQCEKDGEV